MAEAKHPAARLGVPHAIARGPDPGYAPGLAPGQTLADFHRHVWAEKATRQRQQRIEAEQKQALELKRVMELEEKKSKEALELARPEFFPSKQPSRFWVPLRMKKQATGDLRAFLELYGSWRVVALTVARVPTSAGARFVAEKMHHQDFKKTLAELEYDDLYHLYLYVTLDHPSYGPSFRQTIRLEKAPDVVVFGFDPKKSTDLHMQITPKPEPAENALPVILPPHWERNFAELLARARAFRGPGLWAYGPEICEERGNCQDFVTSVLKGNDLWDINTGLHKFILQDSSKLALSDTSGLEPHSAGPLLGDIAEASQALGQWIRGEGIPMSSGGVMKV